MKPESILDHASKFAGGTISALSTIRQAVKDEVKLRAEDMIDRLDLVSREEYDALLLRVSALEEKLKQTNKKTPSK